MTTSRPSLASSSSRCQRRFLPMTASVTMMMMMMMMMMIFLLLSSTTKAFVPCNIPSTHHSSSTLQYSTKLHPDIKEMKAGDMKNELESYGINTKTMFDKRDFEAALLEARKDYEQTLKDCMSNSQAYEDKKNKKKQAQAQASANSSSSSNKKTYTYDRTNPSHFHEQERMWDLGKDYQARNEHGGGGFRPEPDPVGPRGGGGRFYEDDVYAYSNGGGGPRRRRGGVGGVETDPLFDHEAQYAHGGRRRRPASWGPPPPPPPPHADERQHRRRRPAEDPHPQYSDPAVQMKYHQALEKSYTLKVDELQKELNDRGISTKYCITLGDFCVEYAKAVAEDIRRPAIVDDDDDDDDYDPSYRDVVMEPYDPNKFF